MPPPAKHHQALQPSVKEALPHSPTSSGANYSYAWTVPAGATASTNASQTANVAGDYSVTITNTPLVSATSRYHYRHAER